MARGMSDIASESLSQIWINHLRDRVGEIRLREFRTVDASRMLRAVAKEKDLTKTTLQHIKSVLSTIFTCAKNEGDFDGANPVDGVLIPWNAREPGETHAYDLGQVLQILDLLPLLAKSLIATAAFAGLRRGELRGLEWTDYTGTELKINRSMWRSVVSLPKTHASRDSVPIIPALAEILEAYRRAAHDSASSRGHRSTVARVARVPSRPRLEPMRHGSSRQGGTTHLAPL
jgi:integrase